MSYWFGEIVSVYLNHREIPIISNSYSIAILIQVDTNTALFILVRHFCNC